MTEVITETDPNINDTDALDFEGIQGSPADSQDMTAYPVLPPGTYISGSRAFEFNIKTSKDDVKYMQVKVVFQPFMDEAGTTQKLKPPMTFLNTLPRRDGGLTSVAEYLKAFGVDARLLAGQDLKDAIEQTAEQAVVVRTGIEDSYKDRPAGTRAVRDDFFKRAADGKHISVVKDPSSDRMVKGWPMVYGFRKYTA